MSSDSTNQRSLAGFLVRKTVEGRSLRQVASPNSNEFKAKNIFLYINKRAANIRSRLGENVALETIVKQTQLQNFNKDHGHAEDVFEDIYGNLINVETGEIEQTHAQRAESGKEGKDHAHRRRRRLDKDGKEIELKDAVIEKVKTEIAQKLYEKEFREEFTIETAAVDKKNVIRRTDSEDAKQKLRRLLNERLGNDFSTQILQEFRHRSLKSEIDWLKRKGVDSWAIEERIAKRNDDDIVEKVDTEVSQFFEEEAQERKLTVPSLLNINSVEMKEKELEKDQVIRDIEKIAETEEQDSPMQELYNEEEREKREMVKIFNESRLGSMQINMIDLKRKQLQQNVLYRNHDQEEKQLLREAYESEEVGIDRFIRKKNNIVAQKNRKLNQMQRELLEQERKQKEQSDYEMVATPQIIFGEREAATTSIHLQLKSPASNSEAQNNSLHETNGLTPQPSAISIVTENELGNQSVEGSTSQEQKFEKSGFHSPKLHINTGNTTTRYARQKALENEYTVKVLDKAKSMSENSFYFSSTALESHKSEDQSFRSQFEDSKTRESQYHEHSVFSSNYNKDESTEKGYLFESMNEKNNISTRPQTASSIKEIPKKKRSFHEMSIEEKEKTIEKLRERAMRMAEDAEEEKAKEIEKIKNQIDTKETSIYFNNFLREIDNLQQKSQMLAHEVKLEVTHLGSTLEKDLRKVEQESEQREMMPVLFGKFLEFVKQQNFKREFLEHIIKSIANPEDVVSRYFDKIKMEQFVSRLVGNFEDDEIKEDDLLN